MTDIIAVFRVEHPDIALTKTVATDEAATIRPIREAGTDPESNRYLFSVTTDDFDQFERGASIDPTIAEYDCVYQQDGEAIYAFSYSDQAILFSTEVSRLDGVIVSIENEGTTWRLKCWFPDRQGAQDLWTFANEHDIDIELERISEYESIRGTSDGLTPSQREAILVALEAGYFEEPRDVTLEDVADRLGISEPAASGLLRRGLKRIVLSTLNPEDR